MKCVAKLNLAAIEKINDLVEENPSIGFLKTLFKPMYIFQNDKLKFMADNFNVAKSPCLGTSKYNVSGVVLQKNCTIKRKGKWENKTQICGLIKVSWSAIDGHIKYEHFNKTYSCPNCMKKCRSIDGSEGISKTVK